MGPERGRHVLLQGLPIQQFEGRGVFQFEDDVGIGVQIADTPVDRLHLDVLILLCFELTHDHCLLCLGDLQLRQVG